MTTAIQQNVVHLDTRTPEMQRLIIACESITQEAFTFADIGRVIQTNVGKLGAVFKDIARFMTTWDYSQPTVLNASSLQRVLTKGVRYIDIEHVVVYKPLGFKGNIEQYAQSWKNNQIEVLSGILSKVLLDGQKFLGYYLNDPLNLNDKRIAVDGSKTHNDNALKMLLETEKKWFPEGERSNEAPVGELFPSNTSLINAFTLFNEINQLRWSQANPNSIAKEFLAYNGLAEALLSLIQGKEHPVSPIVLKEIAHRVELTARWVELYSALSMHLSDMTSALKQTEEKLLKSF